MTKLSSGESVILGDQQHPAVVVEVNWQPVGVSADVYVFLLDARYRFPSDAHLLWAEHRLAPDRSLVVRSDGKGSVFDKAQVQADLGAVSGTVESIMCVLAAHQPNITLEAMGEVQVKLWSPAPAQGDVVFDIPRSGANKCLVLCELRRGAGGWTFQAIGRGFAGHIRDLALNYG